MTPSEGWISSWFARKIPGKTDSTKQSSPIRAVAPLEAACDPQFFGGSLLTDEDKHQLWKWLPPRQQIKEAKLIYSGEKHGYNLHTLYRMSEQVRPLGTLLDLRGSTAPLLDEV